MKKLHLQKKDKREEEKNSALDFILENLTLHKFKLDDDSIKQMELMEKIYKILPKARHMALTAKNRLEFIESDIAKEIRKNPKKYGLDKVSDTVVYKETKGQPEYKKALASYLYAKTKEDEYSILLNAIQERGRQIKYLLEMWLNNYYTSETYVVKKRKKSIPLDDTEE